MKKTLSTQAKEPIRLRSKKLANGNLFLYLDFYRDGKREYEFLKLYLVPEKTKADKIKNEETLRTANAIKAQKIVALQNEEHGFTVSGKSKIKFIDFMVVQAKNYEERGSYAYAQSIRNSIYHLRKYKGDAVTLRQVDKAYLLGYIDFLNTTGGKYNKSLSDAAKALYFDVVVIALNKAVKDEIIPTNPAHKINYKDRPQQGEATKQYLTFEEVKALVATPCKYEVLKQAFLFACFCGLRYSDISLPVCVPTGRRAGRPVGRQAGRQAGWRAGRLAGQRAYAYMLLFIAPFFCCFITTLIDGCIVPPIYIIQTPPL
ncbi:site-specific integrase [Phocaeicola barnesiae]|uniref:site-specific integrase n=1 Tax=Phocaeicola barnesiae TaxID=376804 RepID=UPI0025A459DF|nr:site-specific integrase [Phocaeicola barnesiae]MDM8255558.1 site-specific integrase [Phocaeicola barnesiae]